MVVVTVKYQEADVEVSLPLEDGWIISSIDMYLPVQSEKSRAKKVVLVLYVTKGSKTRKVYAQALLYMGRCLYSLYHIEDPSISSTELPNWCSEDLRDTINRDCNVPFTSLIIDFKRSDNSSIGNSRLVPGIVSAYKLARSLRHTWSFIELDEVIDMLVSTDSIDSFCSKLDQECNTRFANDHLRISNTCPIRGVDSSGRDCWVLEAPIFQSHTTEPEISHYWVYDSGGLVQVITDDHNRIAIIRIDYTDSNNSYVTDIIFTQHARPRHLDESVLDAVLVSDNINYTYSTVEAVDDYFKVLCDTFSHYSYWEDVSIEDANTMVHDFHWNDILAAAKNLLAVIGESKYRPLTNSVYDVANKAIEALKNPSCS